MKGKGWLIGELICAVLGAASVGGSILCSVKDAPYKQHLANEEIRRAELEEQERRRKEIKAVD